MANEITIANLRELFGITPTRCYQLLRSRKDNGIIVKTYQDAQRHWHVSGDEVELIRPGTRGNARPQVWGVEQDNYGGWYIRKYHGTMTKTDARREAKRRNAKLEVK